MHKMYLQSNHTCQHLYRHSCTQKYMCVCARHTFTPLPLRWFCFYYSLKKPRKEGNSIRSCITVTGNAHFTYNCPKAYTIDITFTQPYMHVYVCMCAGCLFTYHKTLTCVCVCVLAKLLEKNNRKKLYKTTLKIHNKCL